MIEDLRILLRELAGRKDQPTAVIIDSRTLQSTSESGARAGYDGAKRRTESKAHTAVDTLGHLLALHVTATDEQDRAQVEALAKAVQQITGEHVELPYVDQGYTGENAVVPRQSTACNWEWSSTPKPSAALFCCRAVGSSSAVSPGLPASAGWRETTNDWPLPWLRSITSPLLASCSRAWPELSPKVDNRL